MATHGRTTWVEVDLGALKHNLTEVRRTVGASVKVMAVVKADAYGHGLVQAALAFADVGADYFGVTTLEEGLALRDAGLTIPVLVFSPLLPDQMGTAIRADLDQTLCDLSLAESLAVASRRARKAARVHVKIDTGMGRLGILPDDCVGFMHRLLDLQGIKVAGIYTHFAEAGAANPSDARAQNLRFSDTLDWLAAGDIPMGLRHAANSAAILNLTGCRYDMVRPGTILYGQFPTRHVEGMLDLRPTWCLKTRIVSVKKLPAGASVGYSGEFTASRPTLAAVIPIGYSDGFTLMPESIARRAARPIRLAANRLLGSKGQTLVTIHGKTVRVIGRVSMQMCSVDVTDIPEVQVGDEVIVPARRTTTSSRIARVYVD